METRFSEQEVKNLLGTVKLFQPELGEYQFFTVNDHFLYLVQLSNGTIRFNVNELLANREQRISKEQLILIASNFQRSGPQRRRESIIPDDYSGLYEEHAGPKKPNSVLIIVILAAVVVMGAAGATVAFMLDTGPEIPAYPKNPGMDTLPEKRSGNIL